MPSNILFSKLVFRTINLKKKKDLPQKNEVMPTKELLRRVLQNQRTLLEQNDKLLKQQDQQAMVEKEQGRSNLMKAPAFVKVSRAFA